MKEFRDRVAVVTGAASGIGRGLAERFAAEGMKVVLADIEEDALRLAEAEFREKGADVPFKLFLFGLARHDNIHAADMLKALPECADDPELKAWLDDPAVRWYQDAMSGPPRR